jgi:hypothetical protein
VPPLLRVRVPSASSSRSLNECCTFKVLWANEILNENTVRFSHVSADGDEGYPGEVHTTVTYTLTERTIVATEPSHRLEHVNSLSQAQHALGYRMMLGRYSWH